MRAFLVLAAVLVLSFLLQFVLNFARPSLASEVVWGLSQNSFEDSLPEGFEEEVFSLAYRSEVRVANDGGIVGFCEVGDAAEVFGSLSSLLEEGGWLAIESEQPACGSFLKSEGQYTWLFVNCTQAGSLTSVVIFTTL